MTDILVNMAGLLLMAAIVVWFWLGGDKAGKKPSNNQPGQHH
jgi:hypothetical protein